MSVLQQKAQAFIDALSKKASERGHANVQANLNQSPFGGGELHVVLTIDGKTDSYVITEDSSGIHFIRNWNGVM